MKASLVLLPLIMAGAADAGVVLPVAPTWRSPETTLYGTGLDVGDIDGDGWLDLAVSNGNDIVAAPNLAYHSQAGVLPAAATWTSDDALYSGHCRLADVDGDGHPELMVANYIAEGWGPTRVQLYDNEGGVLATTPTWQSTDGIHSFRATFGDPDGDGDLDLAVATGEAYHAVLEPNLIFFNHGGVLETAPGWTSASADASYDVAFVDVDADGDQDLAFLQGGPAGRVVIHFNEDGVLDPQPGWTTATDGNGNTFDFDDLDGDGRPDLLVGYNDQFGGDGHFAAYLTDGGTLPTSPTWTSAFDGYGSAVVCADLDGRNGPDLVCGGWWEPVRVYLNDGGGGFAVELDWQSATASVVENIALADLDGRAAQEWTVAVPGGAALIELPHRHLQAVTEVAADGVALTPDQVCHDLRNGWVSVGAAAAGAAQVRVTYQVSPELDLAVSNWDDATFVFERPTATAAPPSTAAIADLGARPNPFNPRTVFAFTLGDATAVSLRVFDLRGREVARPYRGPLTAGRHEVPWQPRDLPSGVYLYRLDADGATATGKVVLAR